MSVGPLTTSIRCSPAWWTWRWRRPRLTRERGEQRPVRIAPVVWKLRFTRDVERALQAEIDHTARRLDLLAGSGDPAHRVASLYEQLLGRSEREASFTEHATLSYVPRQERLLIELGRRLSGIAGEMPTVEPEQGDVLEIWGPILRQAERKARRLDAGSGQGGVHADPHHATADAVPSRTSTANHG